MAEFFKKKRAGFYVTVTAVLLALITMIIYVSYYGHGPREANIDCMNWYAFAFILVGIIGAAVLIALKQDFWAAVCVATFTLISFPFYVYGVYGYVSVVAVGIDLQTLSPGFLASTIFYVLTLVCAYTSVFLKQQVKELD